MKFKIISLILLVVSLISTAVILDGDNTQGSHQATPSQPSSSKSGPSQDAMKNLSF